ncbi:MAG TPA: helix-turn-helix domain-containing protein [Acidimicrobiia bacterium]|nr:helix-turn-helix domain-containing protein [Acidimicrobiia bacterium]
MASAPATVGPRPGVGPLLRDWRVRRRRSQLDLALGVGVSARHLSFVETGRSRPSPELVLAVADELDVPLRERNTLLLAAGYAPRYGETPLDAAGMARVRTSLQRMLDSHDPYPGVVIDRLWNVVLANRAAGLLTAGLPDALLGPPPNVFRVCLHPDGLASRTRNFAEWSSYLLGQLHRLTVLTGDAELRSLADEVAAYPNVGPVRDWRHAARDEPQLLVPVRVVAGDDELSMFTTLTTFGTPQDITLAELSVELFYPADDASDALLRAAAEALPDG